MSITLPEPTDPVPRLVRTVRGPVGVAEEGPPGGCPIICVHGIPGSSRDYRYLGPLLARRYRVLRLDMPGFGIAPRDAVLSVEGWSEVPLAVADALGLRRFLLASHSFGAASVIRLASRRPDRVLGAALLAPLGPRRHRGFGIPPAVFSLYAALLTAPPTRAWAWNKGRTQYERLRFPVPEDWRGLRHHLRVISTVDFARVGREARRIEVPTVIVHARDDPLIEVEIVRELAGLIPYSDLREFDEGGHHVQKTRATEAAAALDEHFERC